MSYFQPQKGSKLSYDEDDFPILRYDLNDSTTQTAINPKTYENNTFIDWYTETMAIPKDSKFVSKKWLSIILTAVVSGYLVTVVDLTSVWLNDLRKGICLSKLDKWSLLNPYLSCPVEDWSNWSDILFNSSSTISSILVNFPLYILLGSVMVVITVYIAEKNLYILQSGIPEIKEIIQGFNYDLTSYLGFKTLCFKILGLVLMVSSGFWLGKEGPLVHVSCCILNVLYTVIFGESNNEAVRRELLSAATATGISLAFNSPVGGVLFVLECIPSYFIPTKIMWNSFISSAVGLLILVGFRLFTEGEDFNEGDLFSVEFGNVSWFLMEVIPFTGLGVMGAFYGHYFTKLYTKFQSKNFRKNLQYKVCELLGLSPDKGNYVEIMGIFLLTSILNYPLTMTRLPLSAFLKILFKACPADPQDDDTNSTNFMCSASDWITLLKLGYIAIQAFLLTAYTFGTILPGGVLMPSLVIGAVCGRFVGILSSWIQNHIFSAIDLCTANSCLVSPSSYAVIGAGAFMTGITKLTMCVVVILFELTGAVTYVLPIMMGVMVSKFVNDYLSNENIYDTWLKNNFNRENHTDYNSDKGNGLCNYSTSTSTVKNKLPDINVSRIMVPLSSTKCLQIVPTRPYTIGQIHQFLNDDTHEGYPVIANESLPICLGYIHKTKILTALNYLNHPNDTMISFQVSEAPSEILSQQIRLEQRYGEMINIELNPEKSFIIMNDKTSVRLLIDVFEKMYLNYLIIYKSNSNPLMAGFIDRFMIARLIDEGFESLKDEISTEFSEFDIDNDIENSLLGRQRQSIELIS